MTTEFKTWGEQYIDQGSKTQMDNACSLPVAVAGALMPDAHLGYGLPIGGVLGLKDAVCPYAVGVDIACRMKMSIFDISPEPRLFDCKVRNRFAEVLERDTYFGVGVEHGGDNSHPVLTADWDVSPVTSHHRAKARRQLGTSGSGNHFVEWGILTVPFNGVFDCNTDLMLEPGQYLALMSHSGSRGTGASVCDHYTRIAKALRPEYGDLAWLDLGTPEGDEYWAAMQLMGEYAKANHDVIHRNIARSIGFEPLLQIENHHNFAWKEEHNGQEIVVHRKGATPAGEGVLGIIPGSMGTPAFVVRGLGNRNSLCSSSHGAGRVMSRKEAKRTFNYRAEIDKLAARGITVLSAGTDEVCGVYKNIDEVMAAQTDLVEAVAKFEPKIVKMAGGNEKAED